MTLEQALIGACTILSTAVGVLYMREMRRVEALERKVEACEKSHIKAIEDRGRMWEGFYNIQKEISKCTAKDCPMRSLQPLMPSKAIETPKLV